MKLTSEQKARVLEKLADGFESRYDNLTFDQLTRQDDTFDHYFTPRQLALIRSRNALREDRAELNKRLDTEKHEPAVETSLRSKKERLAKLLKGYQKDMDTQGLEYNLSDMRNPSMFNFGHNLRTNTARLKSLGSFAGGYIGSATNWLSDAGDSIGDAWYNNVTNDKVEYARRLKTREDERAAEVTFNKTKADDYRKAKAEQQHNKSTSTSVTKRILNQNDLYTSLRNQDRMRRNADAEVSPNAMQPISAKRVAAPTAPKSGQPRT